MDSNTKRSKGLGRLGDTSCHGVVKPLENHPRGSTPAACNTARFDVSVPTSRKERSSPHKNRTEWTYIRVSLSRYTNRIRERRWRPFAISTCNLIPRRHGYPFSAKSSKYYTLKGVAGGRWSCEERRCLNFKYFILEISQYEDCDIKNCFSLHSARIFDFIVYVNVWTLNIEKIIILRMLQSVDLKTENLPYLTLPALLSYFSQKCIQPFMLCHEASPPYPKVSVE